MNAATPPMASGRVASLHLHPADAGAPLVAVEWIEAVAGQGIRGEPRYFGKRSSDGEKPSRRQLTLIARGEIAAHAQALGMAGITPGAVRANIETTGATLQAWVGWRVRIGEALIWIYDVRHPCAKMDAICVGLRALMSEGRQGVLAEIVEGGRIRVGDEIAGCERVRGQSYLP